MHVEVQGKCPAGTLSFSLIDANSGSLVSSQCSDQIKAFHVSEIQGASLSIELDSTNSLRGMLFVSAVYTTLGQAKSAIYGFSIKASLSDFYPIKAFTIKTPTSFIDMGVDPSAKIVKSDGKLFVLEVNYFLYIEFSP